MLLWVQMMIHISTKCSARIAKFSSSSVQVAIGSHPHPVALTQSLACSGLHHVWLSLSDSNQQVQKGAPRKGPQTSCPRSVSDKSPTKSALFVPWEGSMSDSFRQIRTNFWQIPDKSDKFCGCPFLAAPTRTWPKNPNRRRTCCAYGCLSHFVCLVVSDSSLPTKQGGWNQGIVCAEWQTDARATDERARSLVSSPEACGSVSLVSALGRDVHASLGRFVFGGLWNLPLEMCNKGSMCPNNMSAWVLCTYLQMYAWSILTSSRWIVAQTCTKPRGKCILV